MSAEYVEAVGRFDAGVARLEVRIREAIDAGQGVYAAELGVVLGVVLERSGRGQARIAQALATVELAADLDGPLRIAQAWRG